MTEHRHRCEFRGARGLSEVMRRQAELIGVGLVGTASADWCPINGAVELVRCVVTAKTAAALDDFLHVFGTKR